MPNSYICNKDIFKHIYKLEKRRTGRRKYNSYFSDIKLEQKNDNNIKKARQYIEKILSNKLRSGDVVCKWDINHFVLILNNVDDYGASRAVERIKNNFFENIQENNINLEIKYLPIE